mgnify:CR=1 FL=1
MYQTFRRLTLAGAIASVLAISPLAFAASANELSDARQESQIQTTYQLSPYLRAHDISVAVEDGTATLSGKVDENVNKDLAEQIALGVAGVDNVVNNIEVRADYAPAPRGDKRSFGDVVDDASITAAIKNKLMWSKHSSALTTDVDTQWGHVQLKGTASNAAAKTYAGSLATHTRGVNSVDNQLIVDSGGSDQTSAAQDVADAWITTKIKSTFMYSDQVDGSDIEVKTVDGHVTLSGKVDSGPEQALAIQFAENVLGVKDVDSAALTYAAL